MTKYELLDWDSAFFGIPVARILPDRLASVELEQILFCMKRDKIHLAYWASNPNDQESQQAARRCHGFLADKKVTFVMDIGQTVEPPANGDWVVEEYADTLSCADLEDLAVQAGMYSRFNVDPRIPDHKVADLYRLWIQNSVNRQIADVVLVTRRSDHIVGMATVKEDRGSVKIGLFAVDARMRRRKVGVSLVRAVQQWTRGRGLKRSEVVTQDENSASCALYLKCGYRPDRIDYFYHFWIS